MGTRLATLPTIEQMVANVTRRLDLRIAGAIFPAAPVFFRGPKNCILFIYFYFFGSTEKAKLKLTGLSRITVGLVRTLSRVQAWRKTNQFNYPLNCLLKFSWMCNMGPRLVLPQNRKRRRQCRKKTLLNLLLEMAVYLFIFICHIYFTSTVQVARSAQLETCRQLTINYDFLLLPIISESNVVMAIPFLTRGCQCV